MGYSLFLFVMFPLMYRQQKLNDLKAAVKHFLLSLLSRFVDIYSRH